MTHLNKQELDKYKRRIIAWRGDRGACWAVRIHFPLSYIARNNADWFIHVTSVLDKTQDVFDLGILQRQYKSEVFFAMLEFKKRGMKFVYEIDDDLFSVPKWNPAYKVFSNKKVRENIKYFLSNVDAIFVTTEELKQVYSSYCERIYVLPNSVDPDVFYNSPNNSRKKVILWSGSNTHKKDIAIIRDSLEKISRDKDMLLKLWYIDIGIKNAYLIPFCPLEYFYATLALADPYIGLAPLTSIPFNRSKSNLKFLEYTMQGAVTVASNFGPYKDSIEHGVTGILLDNPNELYDSVRYLLDHPDEYTQIINNAKKLVLDKYNMVTNYKLWQSAIEEILED